MAKAMPKKEGDETSLRLIQDKGDETLEKSLRLIQDMGALRYSSERNIILQKTPEVPLDELVLQYPEYKPGSIVEVVGGSFITARVISLMQPEANRPPEVTVESLERGTPRRRLAFTLPTIHLRPVSDKPAPKKRVKNKISFESVIIADEKRQQIIEAIEQITKHDLIFDTWGFADTIEKGRGVAMLFWGPPGTGKTLMGQAIAAKLSKKLKVISTADIESSAPGEAERNIRKVFKDVKESGDIILFDECDSLIFSRSSAGPILGAQINELLSQLEKHSGLTIFTTNRLGVLDEAVNRRLALKLEFAMPSVEERVKIWRRMFPKAAPIEKDIDWERLAQIEISGGYIKNVVLRAARMAAIEDKPDAEKHITMQHLIRALTQEAESMIEFEDARAVHTGTGVRVTNQLGQSVTTGQRVVNRPVGDVHG